MRECELFLGNLFVCEQLSGRERAGKLECSKTGKSSCVFKDVRALLLKEPIDFQEAVPKTLQVKTLLVLIIKNKGKYIITIISIYNYL